MKNAAFDHIKKTALSRDLKTLKNDIIVAYKNKYAKNNDITKTVYHALCEAFIEVYGMEAFDAFEETFI